MFERVGLSRSRMYPQGGRLPDLDSFLAGDLSRRPDDLFERNFPRASVLMTDDPSFGADSSFATFRHSVPIYDLHRLGVSPVAVASLSPSSHAQDHHMRGSVFSTYSGSSQLDAYEVAQVMDGMADIVDDSMSPASVQSRQSIPRAGYIQHLGSRQKAASDYSQQYQARNSTYKPTHNYAASHSSFGGSSFGPSSLGASSFGASSPQSTDVGTPLSLRDPAAHTDILGAQPAHNADDSPFDAKQFIGPPLPDPGDDNVPRVTLGDGGRAKLKSAISAIVHMDPACRVNVERIAKVRLATLTQLFRMAAVCGIYQYALYLADQQIGRKKYDRSS